MRKFKVGDKVIWKHHNGEIFKGKVIDINYDEDFPIMVRITNRLFGTFTKDGRYYYGDDNPIVLFHDISTKINKLMKL